MTNFIHIRKCRKCGKSVDTEKCFYCRKINKKRIGDGNKNKYF